MAARSKSTPALVSTAWLKARLNDANIRVVEAAFTERDFDQAMFKSDHIPGASLFQQRDVGDAEDPLIPWPRPNPDKFQAYCRSLGLQTSDHVIVYDRMCHYLCCRLWLAFKALGHEKVFVLNGGLDRWKADGFETESGLGENREPSEYSLCNPSGLNDKFVTIVEMLRLKDAQDRQIVDVRRSVNFRGEEAEPNPEISQFFQMAKIPLPPSFKAGHIKGSKNLYRDELLNTENFCFKDSEDLQQLFRSADINIHKPTTALCYLGITACFIPVLFQHLGGSEDVKVYTGSWNEYGQRADEQDVAKGPQVTL